MKEKSLGIVVALILIVVITIWLLADGWGVGGTNFQFINATSAPTVGNYDSLQAPRGTAYTVAVARTLRLSGIMFSAATSTTVTFLLGYGDTAVANSVAAPTNAVTLTTITAPVDTGEYEVPLRVNIPAGKVPFLRVTGGGSIWPSDGIVYGNER